MHRREEEGRWDERRIRGRKVEAMVVAAVTVEDGFRLSKKWGVNY